MNVEKIHTFKDLIRLFWDNKNCKIIPLLNNDEYILGYYLKKNVTAHVADTTFLSQKISSAENKILSLATRDNEGKFLGELGEIENFPVIFPDGSYKLMSFTEFLTDHIPLKYENTNIEERKSISGLGEDIKKQNIDENNQMQIDFLNLENKKAENLSKDIFENSSEKIKPFLEEFDFNESFDLVAYLEGIERRIIEKYLNYYEFNVSKTAEALKIPRQTLQYKIKKYLLED